MTDDRENGRAIDGSTHLLEDEEMTELASNSKQVSGDGTQEKLVTDDGKLNSNKEASEVKFISADSQNGDAKIDIEKVKIAFAGMGKEELMKFANDPFWIKMRWLLFVFFWALWISMLVGAVAIIVLAPKCAAPAPLKWWEQAPVYELDVRTFLDGENQDGVGDIQGLHSKLDYIESLGVKGVIISPIFKSSHRTSNDYVVDFKDVDPVFGSLVEVRNLTSTMKNKGLHLIMSFIPNHTSLKHPWFLKSERKEEPYKDYYVWAGSKGTDGEGNRIPPSNWVRKNIQQELASKIDLVAGDSDSNGIFLFVTTLGQGIYINSDVIWGTTLFVGFLVFKDRRYLFSSKRSVYGGPAWSWSEKRQEFYLHQFHSDQPDLNFHNKDVIEEFKDIISFWIKEGVSGFEFGKIQYLLEDKNLVDEAISGRDLDSTVGQYDFYSHVRTTNSPELTTVLDELRNGVRNSSNPDAIFSVTCNVTELGLLPNNGNISSVVDILRNTDLFSSIKPAFTAKNLSDSIEGWRDLVPQDTRVFWELSNAHRPRVASRLSPDLVDGLTAVVMLLPGTPITYYGDELGMLDSVGGESPAFMSWRNSSVAGFSSNGSLNSVSENVEESNVESELNQEDSPLSLYKTLVKARKSPSIMYGTYESTVLNDTVFGYTRLKSGNPGYLVAFNPSEEEFIADFTHLKHMSDELTVLVKTPIIESSKAKYPAAQVTLPARSMLVLTFVPKQK